MKKYGVVLFIASIVLAGCQSTPPAPVVPPELRTDPSPTVIPSQPNQPTPVVRPSDDYRASKPPISSRTIDITVRNWAFSPANISAKKGEKVTLRLTGESGVHGFAVPDFGINKPVRPGESVTVQLPTDTPGTYRFFCSIPCGKGHVDMKGTIVVEE